MPTTKSIGNRGEDIASVYLEQQGFMVLDRNWKTRWCEIDIIASKQECIYFVEVKYRSSSVQGDGHEYVTAKKQQQMSFAASVWVQKHDYEGDFQLLVASVNKEEATEIFEL